MDGFFSQLPFKCYLPEMASVGDRLEICPQLDYRVVEDPEKAVLPDLVLPCNHPGGNPGTNLKSISHRCYLRGVTFEWELTTETIHLPLGCLQGGFARE